MSIAKRQLVAELTIYLIKGRSWAVDILKRNIAEADHHEVFASEMKELARQLAFLALAPEHAQKAVDGEPDCVGFLREFESYKAL